MFFPSLVKGPFGFSDRPSVASLQPFLHSSGWCSFLRLDFPAFQLLFWPLLSVCTPLLLKATSKDLPGQSTKTIHGLPVFFQ